MKLILTVLASFAFIFAHSQDTYWQQQVNYQIDVSLNDTQNMLKGNETIEYINNSPDQLTYIWFHLWPNGYKNEQTAFARQLMRDKEGQKRWKNMKEKGWIDGLDFTIDGQKIKTLADPQNIDLIKLLLPRPLMPGDSITIKTPFSVKIPSYGSRFGFEGDNYMICQWYPKPAVYDRKGWHPIPYLDQGEFYSEYGNYNVSIALPSSYIVGATGLMQNPEELSQYKEMGSKNVSAGSRTNIINYKPASSGIKTLNYKADHVPDFAWFASKDFVVRYDTMQLQSGKTVDIFTYHHPDGNKNWINSTSFVKDGARSYSAYLGEYAYPIVQAVEGPKNEMSGGMEYPMITLITSPDANEEMLDAVITHEVGHNWFCIMLASNERTYPWMDEGINTYFQFRYEAEKYRSNSIFGDQIPAEVKQKGAEDFQAIIYNAINKIDMESPIDMPAQDFKDKEEYGLIEYIKTSLWMYLMEVDLGKANLDRAMHAYFKQWQFRHPYPEDLKAVMEKELNKDMGTYFNLLKKKGSL